MLFAEQGFRGTTMRAVAERAGVDLALVHYYFETKAKLFGAVVELPVDPARIAALSPSPARPASASPASTSSSSSTRNEAITAMLRTALGDPDSIPALRALVQRTLVAGAAGALRGPDAALRAELIGAHMVGLFVCRCLVGVEPLASLSVDDLVARVAPAIDVVLAVRTERKEQP
jgi:AcrR family transcriptional regulator